MKLEVVDQILEVEMMISYKGKSKLMDKLVNLHAWTLTFTIVIDLFHIKRCGI